MYTVNEPKNFSWQKMSNILLINNYKCSKILQRQQNISLRLDQIHIEFNSQQLFHSPDIPRK